MLTAYSRGCDSQELFASFEIAKTSAYEKHRNQYHTIFLNMQDIYTKTKIPFLLIIDEWDCIFREYKEDEVRTLCEAYQMDFEETKKWYDGYYIDMNFEGLKDDIVEMMNGKNRILVNTRSFSNEKRGRCHLAPASNFSID